MVVDTHKSKQKDIEKAIDDVLTEIKTLLLYSKGVIAKATIKKYVKQKTIYRLNIFSGIYQRVEGIVSLIENRQAKSANILLRSIWELFVANEFVNMGRGNYYLEIFRALDAQGIEKQWRQIKRIRSKYPNANTWQDRWGDDVIQNRIEWGASRLKKFTDKYPTERLGKYKSLFNRIEAVDDINIGNNPNFKTLRQMDYYTVYALLSDDVHSTIYGTIGNSRFIPTGVEVRLDKHDLDSFRCAITAYAMLLDYINYMTKIFNLKQASEIRGFRKISKKHHDLCMALEKL